MNKFIVIMISILSFVLLVGCKGKTEDEEPMDEPTTIQIAEEGGHHNETAYTPVEEEEIKIESELFDYNSLSVGDYIVIGSYEQDNNSADGAEPIEWKILDIQDGTALLVSKYVLDVVPYNDADGDATWENCSLRNWMNNDFYNTAFSSYEKTGILASDLVNEDNSYYLTEGGNDTSDNIFCLSFGEIENYYVLERTSETALDAYSSELIVPPTPYSENKKLTTWSIVPDDYTFPRAYVVENMDKPGSNWWLRTPSMSNSSACTVGYGGSAGYEDGYRGFPMKMNNVGICPAMRVDLTSFTIIKSSATINSFESINKTYNIDDVVSEVGEYSRTSGTQNYIWDLEDGCSVWISFSESDRKINQITQLRADGTKNVMYYCEPEEEPVVTLDENNIPQAIMTYFVYSEPKRCDFDHTDDNGNLVFHVYEIVDNHTSTYEWVYVNPSTGEAWTDFNVSFNVYDYLY